MGNGDERVCEIVRAYVANSGLLEAETEIQHATKFSLRSGPQKAGILVYNSGKIHVDGPESELKKWCLDLKKSIEEGTGGPSILLPPEIERLPQTLQERVPACHEVVVWFYQESLRCYKAGSPAAAAFMLGAASEKAIEVLIETYASSIASEDLRQKFLQRVNNKMISVRYDEFKRSYKSAKPKPGLEVAQDLEQMLDGAFNFYRITRNAVGHPQIIPDLDKGVVLANMGQFVTYIERIYALIGFFKTNKMQIG